jgi:hypothetical protein
MARDQIIYEGDHLLVVARERDFETKTVLVTFNEMGFSPTGTRFWGDQIIDKLPISGVGVISKKPNWYPKADMQKAIPAILNFVNRRFVITYGYSQGGYGALKYSAALSACGALSFSPQISINPKSVDFDGRWHQHYERELQNGEIISSEDIRQNSFIFYDPYHKLDRINAEMICQYSGAEKVICPFINHETIQQITSSKFSGYFFDTAINLLTSASNSDDIAKQFRMIVRYTREKSPTYQYALRKRIQSKKWNKIRKHGNLEEARQWILNTPFEDLIAADLVSVWKFCRDTHLKNAELHIAQLISKNAKNDAFLLIHAVQSYISLNLRDEARSLLSDIVVQFGVSKHTHHIREFAKQLKLSGLLEIMSALAGE